MTEKTKLYGKIHYEVRAEPTDREEEDRLVGQQIFEMEHGRPGLQIISRNKASTIVNPGVAGAANWGSNFIVSQAVKMGLPGQVCVC